MTGIRIDGELYALEDLRRAPMGDLFSLKAFTQAKGYGVSLKSINEMFDQLAKQAAEPDFSTMDLLDDNGFLANMVGLVYLVRRGAGEKVSLDEAWGTPFDAFEFVGEDEDSETPKDEAAIDAASVS